MVDPNSSPTPAAGSQTSGPNEEDPQQDSQHIHSSSSTTNNSSSSLGAQQRVEQSPSAPAAVPPQGQSPSLKGNQQMNASPTLPVTATLPNTIPAFTVTSVRRPGQPAAPSFALQPRQQQPVAAKNNDPSVAGTTASIGTRTSPSSPATPKPPAPAPSTVTQAQPSPQPKKEVTVTKKMIINARVVSNNPVSAAPPQVQNKSEKPPPVPPKTPDRAATMRTSDTTRKTTSFTPKSSSRSYLASSPRRVGKRMLPFSSPSSGRLTPFGYPSIKISSEDIVEAMPENASSIFHVVDRRINFDALPPDASFFSLLRLWVQDDPYRKVPLTGSNLLEYADLPSLRREENEMSNDSMLKQDNDKATTTKRETRDILGRISNQKEAPPMNLLRSSLVTRAIQVKRKTCEKLQKRDAVATERLANLGILLPPLEKRQRVD